MFWYLKDKKSNTYVKLGAVEALKGNFKALHNHFVGQFTCEWRLDPNIMLLLGAITLFNADRPHLIHRPLVKYEQHVYSYLLKRYLQLKYDSHCKANSAYLILLNLIQNLRILNEEFIRIYFEFSEAGSGMAGPLLIEIFEIS